MRNVSEESSAHGKCRALIVGERYRKTTGAALEDLGFHVIYMPDNPNVDSRVAGHADLSVLRTGEREIFLAPYLQGTRFEASVRARKTRLMRILILFSWEIICCAAGKAGLRIAFRLPVVLI